MVVGMQKIKMMMMMKKMNMIIKENKEINIELVILVIQMIMEEVDGRKYVLT
jgi:hypothetical protein